MKLNLHLANLCLPRFRLIFTNWVCLLSVFYFLIVTATLEKKKTKQNDFTDSFCLTSSLSWMLKNRKTLD